MAHRILIPTPLRPFAGKQDVVEVEGTTVGDALQRLVGRYGDLRRHLYNEDGRLRSFVNIYVNDEDIRHLDREQTALSAGDTISIVPSVAGGSGAAVREAEELTRDEIQRYSRHLIMPEVGVDGQRKLKAARVLCVGAGGLGAPAAMYLAAAGVGTLGLVDFDVVDASNLHRQIIYGTPDVGKRKLEAARARIAAMNDGVKVVLHELALTSKNALEVLKDYDVTWSTTRACCWGSRMRMAASSGSTDRHPSSPSRVVPAIAACIRNPRPQGSCQAARRAVCWGYCRASLASSRRPKPSS